MAMIHDRDEPSNRIGPMANAHAENRVGDTTMDFPIPGEVPPRVRVSFGARTDRGKVRENNEDHFLVARLAKSLEVCKSSLTATGTCRFSEEEGYLMVVADGMGGAAAGERASALAVTCLEEFVLDTVKWFLHLEGREQSVLFDELRKGLQRADRSIIERAQEDPRLVGMGTTLTMAYSIGTDLFVAHAGDSRAYLLHDGNLVQVTSDHTLAQILVEAGGLSPEQARHDKRRNIVTNVVGGPHEGVHSEIRRLSLADGDILLLCSDGLSDLVNDDDIAAILAGTTDPDEACNRLVQLALENGGRDNITAIVMRYDFDMGQLTS
jgi:protein phosphatase